MEVPSEVMVHNEQLGLKGASAVLLQISPDGYYELNVQFGERLHRVLLPIASTRVTAKEAEATVEGLAMEIER